MLKKEQLERLLTEAMDSGADFAEIFEEDAVSESLSMLDGKVENVDRALREGTGIRLYKDLQTAYGYSNSARYEDLL
ncbi:PmbA/TldA family metallopeptidase, partial [Faecalibaculum rodentium]